MVHLLVSEQSLLLKSTLNKLIDSVIDHRDDFNYANFDFENNSLEEILETLQSSTFCSEKKMVVARNPYFFLEANRKMPFVNDFKLFEEYLYNPNDDCELIIVCPKKYFNEKNKYVTIIQSTGEIINLLIDGKEEQRKYANALIKGAKIEITNGAFELLLERCIDVSQLEKEIAKLSLLGEKVDEKVVNLMVARPMEQNILELSNAILDKNKKKALTIYSDFKLLKVEPISIINMMANQFHLLLQIGILRKQKKNQDFIAEKLNVHPYRIKIFSELLDKYTIENIKKTIQKLSRLDVDIKRGDKDRFVEFELFLASFK